MTTPAPFPQCDTEKPMSSMRKLAVGAGAFIVSGIVCGAVILVLIIAHQNHRLTYVTHRLTYVTSQLQATNQIQGRNRQRNVATWCGAINEQAAVLRGYVALIRRDNPNISPLPLKRLDCAALVARTANSSHQK